jgi:hypothetical protein
VASGENGADSLLRKLIQSWIVRSGPPRDVEPGDFNDSGDSPCFFVSVADKGVMVRAVRDGRGKTGSGGALILGRLTPPPGNPENREVNA